MRSPRSTRRAGTVRKNWEKEYNRQVASLRAPVAHVIAQLKNWKILAKGYRPRLNELSLVITVLTRLELMQIGW